VKDAGTSTTWHRLVVLAALLWSGCSGPHAAALEPSSPLPTVRPRHFPVDELDIRIDGRLEEPVWATLPVHDEYRIIEPDTLAAPEYRTELRFAYTDRGLYVGVMAHQDPETLVSRISQRDQRISRDDISITIDPTGSGLYGYWFTVGLGGTLLDGTVVPERNFTNQWDGPWFGAAAENEEGWSVEMFLPWSMMAMPESGAERTISFYTSRRVAHLNKRYAMPALPRTQPQFMSVLRPLALGDVQPKRQRTFYPFSAATYDAREGDFESKLGSDIYLRPTSNLQISATLNPDFGTVAQDDPVVNLSAFEVFFRERRPFFLEGQEVFVSSPRAAGNYEGGPPVLLINTRRIGAPPSLPNDDRIQSFSEVDRQRLSDLVGAAKVTGQAGNLRYGVLTALERDTEVTGFDAAGQGIDFQVKGKRFGAARVIREVSDGAAYRAFGGMFTAVGKPGDDGYVGALDAHLLTDDGVWKLDGQAMWSQANDKRGTGLIGDLVYTPRQGRIHRLGFEALDENLDLNDFGFLRRNEQVLIDYRYEETRSDLEGLFQRRTSLRTRQGWALDGKYISSGFFLDRNWTFDDLNEARIQLGYRPQRWDDRNSRGNGAFRIDDRGVLELGYNTNNALPLALGVDLGMRHEDLQGLSYDGRLGLTWRPNDRFTADLGLRYADRGEWLVYRSGRDFTTYDAIEWRPEFTVDYFFSARQQLRAAMQWVGVKASEQQFYTIRFDGDLVQRPTPLDSEDFAVSNMVFQLRYRWEIAPLSDLFVVYTRGGSLDQTQDRDFRALLADNFEDPDTDQLVVLLRYRLGS
jgi:hypothetical protein